MIQSDAALSYVLVVNSPAYGQQTALTAYRFAQALIAKGHNLKQVFFYQHGVENAAQYCVPANDEFDLVKAWQQLARLHHVELATCVAAALRRGVVGGQEATLHQLDGTNLAPDFTQAGLGSLAEALLTADRVIQF